MNQVVSVPKSMKKVLSFVRIVSEKVIGVDTGTALKSHLMVKVSLVSWVTARAAVSTVVEADEEARIQNS